MATPTSTNTAISTGASAGSSLNLSVTVASGNQNIYLVAFVSNKNGGLNPTMTFPKGGVATAMTKGVAFGTTISFETDYYWMANPDTGTGTLAVSWTGTSTLLGVAAIVLKDCAQVAPDIDGYLGQNTATSITKSVTTTVANDLLLMWVAEDNFNGLSSAWTEGGTQTREVSNATMGSDGWYGEIASLPVTTATTQAMSLSWTGGRAADELVVALKYLAPTGGAVAAKTSTLPFMGAG